MVRAFAWLVKLVLTAVYPFVVLAMVIATFQMSVSVIRVGQEQTAAFQCHAWTQTAQAMVNVIAEHANVNRAGTVQSVMNNQWNAIHLVVLMGLVIVERGHAHVKQDGVAMTA